jgi:type IV fimbrial biogenesis protein FimT
LPEKRQSAKMGDNAGGIFGGSRMLLRSTRPKGFTLLELLVTLSVAAILTAIAVPSFSSFIKNESQVTTVNSLVYALSFARSEAIKQDLSIYLCPSSDGQTCAANWASGWLVYNLPAGAVNPNPLQNWSAIRTGTSLSEAPVINPLQFLPNGLLAGGNVVIFTFCDDRGGGFAKDIELLVTGRAAASPRQGHMLNGNILSCP